jgi:KipI family sensor histidine kinase inhibitor
VKVNVAPYGDRAVLADLREDGDVVALRERVLAADLPGVGELVPGACTLLVRIDPAVVDLGALRQVLETAPSSRPAEPSGAPIRLHVAYDGEDLSDVARAVSATVDDVVAWHSAPVYTVAFCGFAPGFAYLRGLDERLYVPRLSSPRTRVPAGSVAIASSYTAVYPHDSPGGWRLLGRTDAPLWDIGRTPPALLTPGTRLRFLPR